MALASCVSTLPLPSTSPISGAVSSAKAVIESEQAIIVNESNRAKTLFLAIKNTS
jgi:hypothetical protein